MHALKDLCQLLRAAQVISVKRLKIVTLITNSFLVCKIFDISLVDVPFEMFGHLTVLDLKLIIGKNIIFYNKEYSPITTS